MARAGRRLTNPFTGQTIVFVRTAEDTGGELLELESIYGSAGDAAPPHMHPAQDEEFEVLEGEIAALVDGSERRLVVGDALEIPAGTVHQFRKDEGVEARLRWVTRPALRTGEFLEALFALLSAVSEGDAGASERLPALFEEYRDVYRPG